MLLRLLTLIAVFVAASVLARVDVALRAQESLPFKLVDVTKEAGIVFTHENGAFGKKYLPETLGAGAAFLDYDNDGRQDILLVNGTSWPGRPPKRTFMRLYRNQGNGRFADVTKEAGLAVELYGMGVAAADYDNDGWQDILITVVGQNRLFRNTGKGRFVDVTDRAGLGGRTGFSTSALWFDYDRDGWLDLLVCNYVRWSPETDVYCSADGRRKSYCTPEAYRGTTSWLFRNKGDGTFEDTTGKARIFDSTSKSLGVTLLDYDLDGWPDVFIANDTQPNKLYRNNRNGTFTELGLQAGLAFSEEGRARAGMGVDAADVDNTGKPSIVITNFAGEMLGLYKSVGDGQYSDLAPGTEIGRATRNTLGFGCFFFDVDLDGRQDILVVNGHIDETFSSLHARVEYAEPPHLFLNGGDGRLRDVAQKIGGTFARPKVGRGAAFGDYDGDGDPDVLITTNAGPAYLYRNDVSGGNQVVRLDLRGTKSNRDAIGATVRIFAGDLRASRMVKTGSSYLSQSELPLSFGLGRRNKVDRVVIEWPSGAKEELKGLAAGRVYEIVEGRGIVGEKPLAGAMTTGGSDRTTKR
ncbi:MAG TPA: CRTAC1 family protein [Vicinamibacterales bacterium]|nr:CRTAC1 family protein [Vicinamibacterales bacterium]